jgi:hypothetical protein
MLIAPASPDPRAGVRNAWQSFDVDGLQPTTVGSSRTVGLGGDVVAGPTVSASGADLTSGRRIWLFLSAGVGLEETRTVPDRSYVTVPDPRSRQPCFQVHRFRPRRHRWWCRECSPALRYGVGRAVSAPPAFHYVWSRRPPQPGSAARSNLTTSISERSFWLVAALLA